MECCKRKGPAKPGLNQVMQQMQSYFASFAIWCVRRETFRLALFL
jgi:hypothetical protein